MTSVPSQKLSPRGLFAEAFKCSYFTQEREKHPQRLIHVNDVIAGRFKLSEAEKESAKRKERAKPKPKQRSRVWSNRAGRGYMNVLDPEAITESVMPAAKNPTNTVGAVLIVVASRIPQAVISPAPIKMHLRPRSPTAIPISAAPARWRECYRSASQARHGSLQERL